MREISLNNSIKNQFRNKIILISGGTGSIGLGIVKQLLECKPKMIKILTNDENSIFESRKMLGEISIIKYVAGDVRDTDRLRMAIRNVDIVFHAAAMKHIDICEQNPFDAVKTNVIGTSNILEASIIERVSKFVLISTDKATNPTTTLGASKLLAERLTQDASSYVDGNHTVFSIVRFGNVIGSRGSVFQIFYNQLVNDLPITVTDSRMTRFIMSIPEAASMILKITTIAHDGETFILKMPSVRIDDLATVMVKIFQKRAKRKITPKIKISKVREYERFYEILVTNDEIPFCYDLGDMYKISKKQSKHRLSEKQFNSETAEKIPKSKLEKIVNELMNDYISN